MKFQVYTDGAARENPGPSASGFMVLDEKGTVLLKESIYNGRKTNNVAEYTAIITALKAIGSKYGYDNEIKLSSDSMLVINQINGNYKINDDTLRELCVQVDKEEKRFRKCVFLNVPRENKYISAVDKALNILLDRVNTTKEARPARKGVQKSLGDSYKR